MPNSKRRRAGTRRRFVGIRDEQKRNDARIWPKRLHPSMRRGNRTMKKWEHLRWLKLYVEESPELHVLPVLCRALSDYLPKYFGTTGRIALKGDDPVDAVTRLLRGTQGDRRMYRVFIPMLLECGELYIDSGDLCLRDFEAKQARRRRSEPPPAGAEGGETATSSERDRDEIATRSERDRDEIETRVQVSGSNHSEHVSPVAETHARIESSRSGRDPETPPAAPGPPASVQDEQECDNVGEPAEPADDFPPSWSDPPPTAPAESGTFALVAPLERPSTASPPSSAPGGAIDRSKRARSRRGTRMTDTWIPARELVSTWRAKGFDPESVLPEFRNYWQSVPDRQAFKGDWNRTLENRLRDLESSGRLRRIGEGPVRAADRLVSRKSFVQPMNDEDDFDRADFPRKGTA